MMRKQLIGVLMLALTFALSACAPQKESVAPAIPSLSMEQVSAVDFSPFLQVTFTPRWNAQQQAWVGELVLQNISQQSLTGLQLIKPSLNSALPVLQPQGVYSPGGVVLPDGELALEVNYKVDGLLHHGKAVYRITKENKVP